LTRNSHLGDKSFQAIDYTGIDNSKTKKQNTAHTLKTKEKQKKNCPS